VFQEAVVDGSLTGRQNLELHARLWGVDARRAARRIEDLVRALGISELIDRRVDGYSGGERRRLEIARALVSQPQVLFLDEPTVGLDPRIRQELLDVIAGLRAREEVTILVTTHYLDEAERLADRVAIVHQGRFVALDTPKGLLAGLGDQVLEFRAGSDSEGALQALRDSGTAGADAFVLGPRVTVPLHGGPAAAVLEAVEAQRLGPSEVQVRAPTLDDVYIQLTGSRFGDSPDLKGNGTRFGEGDPTQN
jgi:ABC-2 type transport system ATP-binding protein